MIAKSTLCTLGVLFLLQSARSQNTSFPASSGESVTAMPNPAYGALQVQTHNPSIGIKSVGIYSLTGELLSKISQGTFSSETTIPLSRLPQGYYFVTILLSDGTSVTRRFAKE